MRQGNNLAWVAAATGLVVVASHMKAVEVQHLLWEIVAAKGVKAEGERVPVQWQTGPEEAVHLQRDPEAVLRRQREPWMAALMQRGPGVVAQTQRGPEMVARRRRGPETEVRRRRGPGTVARKRRDPGKAALDPCNYQLQWEAGPQRAALQLLAEAARPAAAAGQRRGARTVHRRRTAKTPLAAAWRRCRGRRR